MVAEESVSGSGDELSGGSGNTGPGSEAPTPPAGIPVGGRDLDAQDLTPPSGIPGVVGPDGVVGGVIGEEDFGQGGPAVLGGEDPVASDRQDDTGDWPTLEYRSRNKPQRGGTFDWLRRRRDGE